MGGEREGGTTRRSLLRAAAAAGTLAGISNVTTAQPAEIALDARVSGWVGRSPPSIAGRTNPTLQFAPGRTYRVTWTNVDGVAHNLVLLDGDGSRLEGTELVTERGASRTLEFEATPALSAYLCEVHPGTMRGSVAVGPAGATANATSTEGETTGSATTDDGTTEGATTEDPPTGTTEPGPPPVLDATTVVLGAHSAYWLGLAPGGIQGRFNPTLRLRAGSEYDLVWINLDGVEHDFHLADGGGADLADTSSREDAGDTHETSFEATREMARYYCAFHPQSMLGAVEIVPSG